MQQIRLQPEPYCPKCGGRMRLKRPQENQYWKPFWGCRDYPSCNGTRAILPSGEPEPDSDLEFDPEED